MDNTTYQHFTRILQNLKNEVRNEQYEQLFEKQKLYEICLLFDLLVNSKKSNKRDIRSHRQKDFDTTISLQSLLLSHCVIVSNENERDSVLNANQSALLGDQLFYIKYIQKKDNLYRIPFVFDLGNITFLPDFINFKNETRNNIVFSDRNLSAFATKRAFESDIQKRIHKICRNYGECSEDMLFDISKTTLNNIFKDFEVFKVVQTVPTTPTVPVPTVPTENMMWEEIYEKTGVVPRDCQCKAYSNALYDRCIRQCKGIRGLCPKHAEDCDRRLVLIR